MASDLTLRSYLTDIAAGYSRDSLRSPGHALLSQAAQVLNPLLPGGLKVTGSGGKGVATLTPWIGVFDPDETESPLEGVYLVYIYAADLSRVVLTLNQGVTRLRERFGNAGARTALVREASALRSALDDQAAGTASEISFGSSGALQRAYEAGNIAAIEYTIDAMPEDEQLVSDLRRFVSLYQAAVAAKQGLLLSEPGTISSPSAPRTRTTTDPLREFAPKDDADYVAHLQGQTLVKTRRHEALVRSYGEYAQAQDLNPATNVHPRDMTLRRGPIEWLVEAKIVYGGNTTNAVRDAIGQLLQYRHFLYPEAAQVRLVALFSEEIGPAYVELLESLAISAVWKSSAGWRGGVSAMADGLA